MLFCGLQKLTLLDYPDKAACTLFTPGCNWRCPYCHNASLLAPAPGTGIGEDEVLAFLEKRQGLLDGVCVSGGEPLLHPGLANFLRRVRALGFAVKLDTNGSQPAQLHALLREGLVDYVAMDLKNSPEKYAETIGVPGFNLAPVQQSIDLLRTGNLPHEFRTTVVRQLHTAEDLAAIGRWIAGAPHWYLQSFVDSGDVLQNGLSAYTPAEMQALRAVAARVFPSVDLRGI